MSYSTEEIIEPFWAAYSSEARGRDPLAVQNSSVVIYTKMIAGITNVTNRIRYNGFYCWLIDTILKDERIVKKNSLEEQIRFVRRSELLLAFFMVKLFPDTTGVSGSDFAKRNLNSEINLKTGADWDTKSIDSPRLYWKFKSGAFGQYFSGVMRELNLIHHPQVDLNIYTLTDKGNILADAFRKNISDQEAGLFWELVYKGTLTEDDLENLTSFSLTNIPPGSPESDFYKTMLLSEDNRNFEPTHHRRNSIHLLLDYLKTENEGVDNLPLSFLKNNYNQHTPLEKLSNHSSTSWYLFEINELLHVAFEHFHACFLYYLETYPQPINEILERIIEDTNNEFISENINANNIKVDDFYNLLIKENEGVYEYFAEMGQKFRERDLSGCLLDATKVIFTVYHDCENQIDQLSSHACLPENNFNRQGYAIELLEDFIQTKWHITVSEYIKSVLLLAINQHTFSSYRKTRIGQSLVHNYMIEDNRVWRLRETLPSRTSPRLQNVVQYINDVGWVTKESKTVNITEDGNKLLSSL